MDGTGRSSTSGRLDFIDAGLRASATGRLTGLLLGQLDAFNRISTTFGYAASEAFCRRYAEQLQGSLLTDARVVALSGRRFAALVPLESMSSVIDIAARLAEKRPPQVRVRGESWLVDLTLGIAVYPTHGDDAASLFRRAELALEEARDHGLTFDIYRPETTQQHAALWKLTSDLEKAAQHGELDVYFQPKLDLRAGRVGGLEALVRWRNGSGRPVPPEDFIPLAERSGSIVPITWLVFDRVRAQVAEWPASAAPLSVAINVAPQIFAHADFRPRLMELKQTLDRYGVGLILEITEDSLIRNEEVTVGSLARLHKLGVELSLDDFGRGYSSLGYLKEIPAAELKIDKRFVGAIAADAKDRQIVGTVVALAHGLGMRVVAEGVDSEASLKVVAKLGCDVAQGFFIARPMRGELLPAWLEKHAALAGLARASAAPRLVRI